MRVARCSWCRLLVPARRLSLPVEILGKKYRCCEGQCDRSFRRQFAAARLRLVASGANAQPWEPGFVTATRAGSSTAADAHAEQLTLHAAAPTARTGRPDWTYSSHRPALERIQACGNNPHQAPRCPVERCPCCNGLGVAIKCEACAGTGAWIIRSEREAIQAHTPRSMRCTICKGHGYVALTIERAIELGFIEPSTIRRPA